MEFLYNKEITVDETQYTVDVYVNEAYTRLKFILYKDAKEMDRRTILATKGECFNLGEWCCMLHNAKQKIINLVDYLDEWDGVVYNNDFKQ